MSAKSVRFSARLPRDVAKSLAAYAKRYRISTSEAAVRLLDEALRTARHPGIDFRWTPVGRQAFVTGTGLAVWELWMIWRAHDKDRRRLDKGYPHLTPAQVGAAIGYAEAYLPEIEQELEGATSFDAGTHPGVRVVKV